MPSVVPQLANVRLRNPIEQEFLGGSGLFRQQNIEKRRIMSVREWAELCGRDDLKAPTREEVEGGRSGRRARTSAKPKKSRKTEDRETPVDEVDAALTLPTPPHTDSPEDTTHARKTLAERQRAKEKLDAEFLASFDPHSDWLPDGLRPEDYTIEFCKCLERMYWRNCSLGKPPWYGADMKGSLFTPSTTSWNVAHLPSLLTRLLSNTSSKISGVNTPYLYFGMWRATFAWHVEDMDLFSINYIHFGGPKQWYAIPQGRAKALETTMKGYFPRDTAGCSQFLRHKSFLASPSLLAQSSVKPNILVQHAGEFVVTFPRGYHAGYNLGFNCAESVNFALESWVEWGLKAAFCGCVNDSVRIDVQGLLDARAANEQQQQESGVVPNMKRKVEVVLNTPPGKSKRIKIAPPTPDSIVPGPTPKAPSFKIKPKPPPLLTTDTEFYPCCLCVSTDTSGLLRAHDPPIASCGVVRPKDGVWRAHEMCARVIPETWVDEEGGEKVVWGVDGIVKDRWMLVCPPPIERFFTLIDWSDRNALHA